MADLIQEIEKDQLRGDSPDFAPGDTVRVLYLVREGNKERIQAFEGVCIARRGGGLAETFALAADRRAALERLIPGTEERYYYECLLLQHEGRLGFVILEKSGLEIMYQTRASVEADIPALGDAPGGGTFLFLEVMDLDATIEAILFQHGQPNPIQGISMRLPDTQSLGDSIPEFRPMVLLLPITKIGVANNSNCAVTKYRKH